MKLKAYQDKDGYINIVSEGHGYLEMSIYPPYDDILFIPLAPKEIYAYGGRVEMPLAEAYEHFRIRAEKGLFYNDHDIDKAKALFAEIQEEVKNFKKIPASYEIKEKTSFEVYKDGNLLTVSDSKEEAEILALAMEQAEKIQRVSKRTKLSEKTVARVLADLEKNEA